MRKVIFCLAIVLLLGCLWPASGFCGPNQPIPGEMEKAPPLVSFLADPKAITKGSSTTLVWSSAAGIRHLYIQPSVGRVGPAGSIRVTPLRTTTYTLSDNACVGEGCKPFIRVNVTVTVTE